MKGKKKQRAQSDGEDGMVYSTNPNTTFADLFAGLQQEGTAPSAKPTLYVSIDRKKRAGKPVTLVEGVVEDELTDLGKALKQMCGVGGTVKEGDILIQGDFRDRVISELRSRGYQVKQKGG